MALGYVDFPPMIALLAWIMNVISGDSLISIHIVPAVSGAAIVFVAGKLAAELGGGRRAQVIAAVATMFSASFAVASIFSMDVLDMLWWAIIAYILIRIIKVENRDPRLWILLGVVAGIGLMTKLTVSFFLLALIVALTLTSRRSYFRSKWIWLAVVIAFAILLPYILWNAVNGWPTVDFYIHHGGLNGSGPLSFLAYQLLIASPLGLPLAIIGTFFFLRSKQGRKYSVLGLSFIILLVLFTFLNAKPYFIMGAYPFLFAGGGVLLERKFSIKNRYRLLFYGYLGTVLISGAALAPLYAPVLPPQTFVSVYGSLTGVGNGAAAQQNAGQFPQYLGDRFGWTTLVGNVSQVYHNLPLNEEGQACIFASNYGEASALIFLGNGDNLPPVISAHNNYFIWGPRPCLNKSIMITVGVSLSQLETLFSNVTQAGLITCSYCMNNENNLPVYVASQPKASLASVWPLIKDFS